MSPAAIERDYLRWGASSKRAGDQIGRYGQGGKAAIGHLGNRFEIVASAAGDEHAFGFEDPAYRDRGRLRTYELHPRKKPVAAGLGYVRIEVGEIDRAIDARRLRDRLAETYRPLLEAERGADRGEPGAGRAAAVGARRAPRDRGPGRWADRPGMVGAPARPVPARRSGGRGPALPPRTPRRLAGVVRPSRRRPRIRPSNRLVGAVELPHVPVTMNKADVDRASAPWTAVEARLRCPARGRPCAGSPASRRRT